MKDNVAHLCFCLCLWRLCLLHPFPFPFSLLLLLQRFLFLLRQLDLLYRLAILLVLVHLVQFALLLLLVLLRWLCFGQRQCPFSVVHLFVLVLLLIEGELIENFANRVRVFTRRRAGLEKRETLFHLLAEGHAEFWCRCLYRSTV